MRYYLSPKTIFAILFLGMGLNTLAAQVQEAELIDYLEITDERLCHGMVHLSPDVLPLMEQLYQFEKCSAHKSYQDLSANYTPHLSGAHKVTSLYLKESSTLEITEDLLILSEGDVVLDGDIIGRAICSGAGAGQHLIIKSAGKIIIRGNIRLSNGSDASPQHDLAAILPTSANLSLLGASYLTASFGQKTDETAFSGGLGGSILLRAKEIIIEGQIHPGNGGNALAGGKSGAGGSITLLAGNTYNKYDLKAGDGGSGGQGGNGGDATSLWTADAAGAYLGRSGAMIGGNGGNAISFLAPGTNGTDASGAGNQTGGNGGNATGTAGEDGGNGGNGTSTNANGTGGNGGNGSTGAGGGFGFGGTGGNGGAGGNGTGGNAPTGGTGTGGNGGSGGVGGTGLGGGNGGNGGAGGAGVGGNTTTAGPGGNAIGGDGGIGGNSGAGIVAGTGGNGGNGGSAQGGDGAPAGTGTCGAGGLGGNNGGVAGNPGSPCNSGILPVELVSFNAQVKNDMVELSWETATELNNDFFQIEHSRDGVAFISIGKVRGVGTTTEIIEYDFLHRQAVTGTNYYRLKQVDFDGAFEYSNIISINMHNSRKGFSITPNPSAVNGSLLLDFGIISKGKLSIYNQLGAKVFQSSVTENQNQLEILLPDLPAGIYSVELITQQDRFVEQLVIK